MDKFTKTARSKVSFLIRKDSFDEILAINDDSVYLLFNDGSGCKIDGFGRVYWIDENKEK